MLKSQKVVTEFGNMKNKEILRLTDGEYAGLENIDDGLYECSLRCYSKIGILFEISLENLGEGKAMMVDFLRKIKNRKDQIVDEIVDKRTELKKKTQLNFYETYLKKRLDYASKNVELIDHSKVLSILDEIDARKRLPKVRMPVTAVVRLNSERVGFVKEARRAETPEIKELSKDVARKNKHVPKMELRSADEEELSGRRFETTRDNVVSKRIVYNLRKFEKEKGENMFKTGFFRTPMISMISDERTSLGSEEDKLN